MHKIRGQPKFEFHYMNLKQLGEPQDLCWWVRVCLCNGGSPCVEKPLAAAPSPSWGCCCNTCFATALAAAVMRHRHPHQGTQAPSENQDLWCSQRAFRHRTVSSASPGVTAAAEAQRQRRKQRWRGGRETCTSSRRSRLLPLATRGGGSGSGRGDSREGGRAYSQRERG